MARKEITIDIRDGEQTLTFKIKQMPATRLERWILRALLLAAGSGVQVPDNTDIKAAGAFLAEKGLAALGNIDFERAAPLYDELLACCSRLVGKVEERCTPETVDAYVSEVATLFKLRMEAAKLNLGFLGQGAANPFGSPDTPSTETPRRETAYTPTTPTCPA